MRDKKQIELLEEMIQETPTALSIAVPTFTLKALLKNCWDSEILRKKIEAEKVRGDYYEKQLRQLEKQITGNLMAKEKKGRRQWQHANDVTGS